MQGKKRKRESLDRRRCHSTRGASCQKKERRFKARSSHDEQRFRFIEQCSSSRRKGDGDQPRGGAARFSGHPRMISRRWRRRLRSTTPPLFVDWSVLPSGDNSPSASSRLTVAISRRRERHCGTYPSCEFKKESLKRGEGRVEMENRFVFPSSFFSQFFFSFHLLFFHNTQGKIALLPRGKSSNFSTYHRLCARARGTRLAKVKRAKASEGRASLATELLPPSLAAAAAVPAGDDDDDDDALDANKDAAAKHAHSAHSAP